MTSEKKIIILFRNGVEFELYCENFQIVRGPDGKILALKWEKVSGNIPLYFDVDEIMAIYQSFDE